MARLLKVFPPVGAEPMDGREERIDGTVLQLYVVRLRVGEPPLQRRYIKRTNPAGKVQWFLVVYDD